MPYQLSFRINKMKARDFQLYCISSIFNSDLLNCSLETWTGGLKMLFHFEHMFTLNLHKNEFTDLMLLFKVFIEWSCTKSCECVIPMQRHCLLRRTTTSQKIYHLLVQTNFFPLCYSYHIINDISEIPDFGYEAMLEIFSQNQILFGLLYQPPVWIKISSIKFLRNRLCW